MRKKEQINESGRSMVEMLGTLAIMGVLSIGGVAGYRYAMDKLNANTILSEISKRAMTASQQRLVGQSINLNEYGAAEIQKFPVAHTNDFDGDTAFFSLSVSNVPKGICDKVIQGKLRTVSEVWLNTDTDVTDGGTCDDSENGNTIEFVFANTLDTNAVPTEPAAACDPACTGGQECQNGTCACPADTPKWNGTSCEACPTGTSADNTGGSVDGTACKCPTETPVWDMFTQSCRAKSTNCTVNDDCASGQYCKVTGYEDNCSANGVIKPIGGTCTDLSAATITDAGSGFTEKKIYALDASGNQTSTVLKTVYEGPSYINWWTANNLCRAYGKNLLDPSWFQCYDKDAGGNGTPINACCNATVTGIEANSDALRSDKMRAFIKVLRKNYWVRTSQKHPTHGNGATGMCTSDGCDSCAAYRLNNDGCFVGNWIYKDDWGFTTLCE